MQSGEGGQVARDYIDGNDGVLCRLEQWVDVVFLYCGRFAERLESYHEMGRTRMNSKFLAGSWVVVLLIKIEKSGK